MAFPGYPCPWIDGGECGCCGNYQDRFVLGVVHPDHVIIDLFMKTPMFFYILGSVFLSLIITDMILWIIISSDYSKSFNEVAKESLNHWPRFIKTPIQATLVNISLGVVSILLFIGGYVRSVKKNHKRLGIVLIVLAGFLTFWQIFSLM
jgi:hypothetical protein